jgi:hypothetical protein
LIQPKGQIDKYSVTTLIAVNAIPLYGVLAGNWDGIAVIILYMMESIIIGLAHALRLLFYGNKFRDKQDDNFKLGNYGLTLFFLFHYFFFVFVQSVLLFGFVEGGYPGLKDGFNVLHNYSLFFVEPYKVAIYAFIGSQIVYTIREIMLTHPYEDLSAGEYMFLPYSRIFVQQFVVIFGAMIYMLSGSITAVVVLLIILKTLAEYLGQRYGERWLKPRMGKQSDIKT